MKYLVLFFFPFALMANEQLAVALMIKNEAHSVVETLEPLVAGGITSYLIYDTGSTDNTLGVVDQFFKKLPQVKAVVKQEPFVDFATSRNCALDLAKAAFPKAEFILMPDAEWVLQGVPELLAFCQRESKNTTPSYIVRVLHGPLDYYSARLTRANGPARYVGRVHEAIAPYTPVKTPETIYFACKSHPKGVAQSKERWKRDRTLLELDFFENSANARTVFYLAQTCACLEDYASAYQYYLIRTKIEGWPEENYLAQYRLAEVTEQLALTNPAKVPEALSLYMEAYNMRPTRAEPLIRIANHYLTEEKHALSFLFAEKACRIEYPESEVLFVDKHQYDFERYDILSRCAWYVGQKEAGYQALKKALAYNPEAEHLKANLKFYE